MRKSKFEYDTAVNGLLAVQAYQSAERPFDIIFMGTIDVSAQPCTC
jgi:hypothetical protein